MIMLEFLTSKMAMMIEDANDLKLRNCADTISSSINSMNSINGETRELITFQKGKEGIYLEPEVDGRGYEIRITRYKVMIKQEDNVFIEQFITAVHLWEPEKTAYDLMEFQDNDDRNPQLNIISKEDIVIERKLINLQGENGYMTFVYRLQD
jgi:hypothetical protein